MSNLTNFRSEVAGVLGLDNSTSGDQTLMDVWINEGVADVLVRTHCKVSPFTMTLTSGEDDYTLSTSVLAILDLFVDSVSGDDMAISRVSPSEILLLRLNASAATSTSPVTRYAVAGSNLLMVYPTPSAADVLTGLYVPRPTTLSSGSDTPSEIPAEFHKLVSFYALWRGADMDDDQSSEQGEKYRALYEAGCAQLRQANSRKGGSRIAPGRVNMRRRRAMVPHSNSQDI